MYFGLDPFWKAGHESAGVTEPSPTWFLAEGATGPFFETFVLFANPGATPATVNVRYLPSMGAAVDKTYTVPARARLTVNIEAEDSTLTNAAVATQVSSNVPILVERAQYWPDPAPNWYEAHNSFGVTSLGTRWGLAEGRVGGPSDYATYILLANPGSTVANVSIDFLRSNGTTLTKTFTVQPESRFNVQVGGLDVPEITNDSFGAVITSSQPIAVERAQYWPDPAPVWYEAHNSFGVTATGTKWGLAEGRSGGPREYQTYILLANPGTTKANVTVAFLREGQAPVEKTYEVNPRSRFNVDTSAVSELAGLNFGAAITSDQPIAVERAMYNNANGQLWAAGTNATATPLP
jgi:hypothetical protein